MFGPRPVGLPKPVVTVSYDRRNGHRAERVFDDPWQARTFYVRQSQAGKNPSCTTIKPIGETMSKTPTTKAAATPVKAATAKTASKAGKAAKAADAKPTAAAEGKGKPVAKPVAAASVKDLFRSRPGSQAFDINKCLSGKPVTVEAIVAKVPSTNASRVRGHLQRLLTDKLVEYRDGEGYVVAAAKKAKK